MNTARVKIRVIMNGNGDWAAYSWGSAALGATDEENLDGVLYDMMGDKDTGNVRFAYVTADVPLPEDAEVIGTVE